LKANSPLREILHPAVLVGALGYFVDIYDLTLFAIVRVASLNALGITGADNTFHGLWLQNVQMIGMLVGGLAFGILGDKRGRLTVLFGSIILYSLANLLNGLVTTLPQYYALRFLAGVGLAGEIGGSITLVTEVLSRQNRGYGTMIVATIGVMGAVVGFLVANLTDWRVAYFIGGGMGIALLVLRISVAESGMFNTLKKTHTVARGRFFTLFTSRARFMKYLRCILIGLPSWFVVGILGFLSPEFGLLLGVTGPILAGQSIMLIYIGLTFGDLLSGLLSQWFQSRKRVVLGFMLFTLAGIGLYFGSVGRSPTWFYSVMLLLGVGIGFWALFITIAAEQFGTNIRATVATTVPNFVRVSTNIMTIALGVLTVALGGKVLAGLALGAIVMAISLWALSGLEETFGKDLDYHEPL
jgi:MFS transporter, putative metabolite:H+ symporter